jgi:hypothetical protein
MFSRFLLIFLIGLSAGILRGETKPGFIWGINGHPFTAYPDIGIEEQLRLVERLGLTSYRVNVASLDHMAGLLRLVQAARPLGIEILPVLTPPLDLEKLDAATLYQRASAFAVHFASRLGHDIRVWELGNEMENFAIIQPCEMQDDDIQYNCEWGPASGVGPLEYYGPRWKKVSAVLKGLSDGVISVDPQLIKAMGTAGWGHVGAFDRMREDGIAWDISVWHNYGDDLEWGLKQLQRFGKPVWLTEFNNPHGSQKGEEAQAKGLIGIMSQIEALREKYRIEAAHIYELLDEPYWAPDFEAYMGLVRLEQRQGKWTVAGYKPVFCAVRGIVVPGARADETDCSQRDGGAEIALVESQLNYGYQLVLQRRPDPASLKSWTQSILAGKAISGVLADLFNSEEAALHLGTATLSDADFIQLVYRRLLVRDPDQGGQEAYLSRLRSGAVSRTDLVQAVINSSEFAEKHPILFTRQTGG